MSRGWPYSLGSRRHGWEKKIEAREVREPFRLIDGDSISDFLFSTKIGLSRLIFFSPNTFRIHYRPICFRIFICSSRKFSWQWQLNFIFMKNLVRVLIFKFSCLRAYSNAYCWIFMATQMIPSFGINFYPITPRRSEISSWRRVGFFLCRQSI